jgi:hypothetical protein
LNEPAVPLSEIQTEVLRVLASRRDAESYVSGGAPLNRSSGRYSEDIDFFHDREERVAAAALLDAKALAAAGYHVSWVRQLPLLYTAEVTQEDLSTRLEWVVDSDYGFFPTIRDDVFGYVLHPVDLALNKVMAAVGSRELRDIVDLIRVHDSILPLGALIWAAVEKSAGFTPEGLIAEIRRNMCYPEAEWRALASGEPIKTKDVVKRLRAALDAAEAFVVSMPTEKIGVVFLENGEIVQPDVGRLDDYESHAGQKRGHWPSSAEIGNAMLEQYINKPSGQDPR